MALMIAIKPAGAKDTPPNLPSPESFPGKGIGESAPKDRSTQFCDNCQYYCTDGYCMMYPEWQAHDSKDWCGQWSEGEPRDLKSDAAAAGGQADPSQGSKPNSPPPSDIPNAPQFGK